MPKKPSSKVVAKCTKKGSSVSSSKVGKTSKKSISLRKKYLGATPGKGSRTGREVIARMKAAGQIKTHPKTGAVEKFLELSDGKWYPIKLADMGHIHDAVVYWNKTGRKHGAKSSVVRKWMLDSKNYQLEHRSVNRSKGAKLGHTTTYQKPLV